MPKQEFPFPMPNGWFCVTRSDEIKAGELKNIKFCENNVAAFRTKSGKAAVLDAYCGYSGINLALCGEVSEEALYCSKTGIKWGTDGSCIDIDGDSLTPESAKDIKIFNYPVVEINGFTNYCKLPR